MEKMTNLQAQRYDLRANLWNNRHQVPSEDSFDRVLVLSPSLADCLQQITTQVRTVHLNDEAQILTEALELMTFSTFFYPGDDYVQAALPYIRSSVIDRNSLDMFVENSSQPRLRSIKMYSYNNEIEWTILESKVLHKYGSQLQSFTYAGIMSFVLINSANAMPRLKKLKIRIYDRLYTPTDHPSIERIIPWHQLSDFSFHCEHDICIFDCAQLLGQMTQLRKLSINLSFVMPPDIDEPEEFPGPEFYKEIKEFLAEKFIMIPKFTKLEVLSFMMLDPILDYRFLLAHLAPKVSAALTKLIIRLPVVFGYTPQSIFFDYSREFPQLETLLLDYQSSYDNVHFKLYDSEDKLTPSPSIRQLTFSLFRGRQFSSSEICHKIPTIFPNLFELNFEAPLSYFKPISYYECQSFADEDVMKMICRLPHLRTLRFMDNQPKLALLLGSIELMCKRAVELKPKMPMLFQVPLGDDFELLKYSTDQLTDKMKQNFNWWNKAAKWIQIC